MNNNLPHNHGTVSTYARYQMPPEEAFSIVSALMKLMSDSKRLRIFWLLCHGEECVTNISSIINLSSSSVSHHLKLLKNDGLIISRREGKEVYYTAVKTPRTSVLHEMTEQIIEMTCPEEDIFDECEIYDSSVKVVNEAHNLLISDLRQHYTIEALAIKFHINQTTLKATFKTVYGKPIGAYMKEYRIAKAKELLYFTDMSISNISSKVGYENPSKFTQAFKKVTGYLPKDFRRMKTEIRWNTTL